jgi:hypothetical protein
MTDRRNDGKNVPDDKQFQEHHGEPMSDEQVARAGEPKPSKDNQTGNDKAKEDEAA